MRKKSRIFFVGAAICLMLSACSVDKDTDLANEYKGVLEIKNPVGEVIITTDNLTFISYEEEKDGAYYIEMVLDEEGTEKFAKSTLEYMGEELSVYVNGVCVSSPFVVNVIINGKLQIDGFDSSLAAYKIVNAIKTGADIEPSNDPQKSEEIEKELPETVKEEMEYLKDKNISQKEPTKIPIEEVPHRDGMYGISDKKVKNIDGTFARNKVRNDVTGNWRVSTIYADVQIVDYVMDYYKWKFYSDKEIHCIVNFYNNTTTEITCYDNNLYVTVFDYVQGEEYDANIMFSGTVLENYIVYKDNGDIEELRE